MPSQPVPPFEPDDSAGFRYAQFALYLEERIRAGDYPPGARLPNARDLGAEHGIAEHTVRHAEMLLSDWGLIRVLAAKGCYVRPRKDWRHLPRRRK